MDTDLIETGATDAGLVYRIYRKPCGALVYFAKRPGEKGRTVHPNLLDSLLGRKVPRAI